jgi:FkbM family methyltransferase
MMGLMLDSEMNALPWGTFRPGLPVRALIGLSRNTLLGRGKLRKQLAQLFFLLHAGPVDSWLWGHRIRLFPDHNVCERKALLRPDRMDRNEYAFLRTQLARARSVFVDVGANAGLYSLYAALNAGEGARILAIEPDAALLARFAFNLGLARKARYTAPEIDVATACVAVGDHDGEGLLSTSGDEGSRSLSDGAGVGRPVQVRRLAALLAAHAVGKITVLKIDVEGYEDRVLPPYLAEVPQDHWPDAIIIEHVYRSTWSVDCIGLCRGRGYRVCGITNNNTLLARAD